MSVDSSEFALVNLRQDGNVHDSVSESTGPSTADLLEHKVEHYHDTYSSAKTIRKEYKDLAAMLLKSINSQENELDSSNKQSPDAASFDESFFSHFNFSWVYPIIRSLYSGALSPENLKLSESEKCDTNYLNFKRNWDAELDTSKPSLMRAIRKTFLTVFVKAVLLKLLWGAVLVVSMGVLVRQLVLFVSDKSSSDWVGWVVASMFLVAPLMLGFLLHHMTSWSVRLGIGLRSAITRAIFDKAMTAKQTTSSVGEILSLISRDANVLFQAAKSIQYLWSGPLEVAALTAVVAAYVELPSLWVVGLCVVTVPLQYFMGMSITNIRERNVLSNNERLLIIHEILYSIKLVKFYTWEDSFSQKIQSIRSEELKELKKAAYIKSLNLALVFVFPPLAAVGTFYLMVKNGTKLVPAVTFTVLTLCNSLRFPLVMFPSAIKIVNDARRGLARIEKFLLTHDSVPLPLADRTGIFMKNASLGYPVIEHENDEHHENEYKSEQKLEVKVHNVTLSVEPGQVMAVIGQCGSGKSSLLKGVLGDCDVASGEVRVSGRIAYVPQNPFIMHGTVRDNILFGLPYDEDWYLQVLRACCLPSDLNTFNHGDMTYLSEGGINLSGGQRQRIALARAVYAKADIYLLDSVLSALDPATGRKCFRRCVQKLMRHAAVVLVTHSVDMLPDCDTTLIMSEGHVQYIGSYDEKQVLSVFPNSASHGSEPPKSVEDLDVDPNTLAAFAVRRAESIRAEDVVQDTDVDAAPENLNLKPFSGAAKSSRGAATWVKETGVFAFIFTVVLFVSTQIVRIFSDYWVRFWVNDVLTNSDEWYVARYGIIIAIFGTMLVVRGILFYVLSFKAARSLYSKLYRAIVEAPTLFFTKEPLGKILKSFSHDQDAVDDSLPDIAHIALIFFSISITTVAIVCMVLPWVSFVAAFVLLSWFTIQKFVGTASNRLKTACAETNSATIVHASESMHGISVIRAFGQQNFMKAENELLVNSNISAVFFLEHIELWAELHIDIIAAFFVFCTALLIVVYRTEISPGDAGLAISNATQLLVFLAMMVQSFGDVFFQMYSVVRINDYIKNTPSEDFSSSIEMPRDNGKPCFPNGEIDIEKIYVAYDPMKEMVLKSVTLHVKAGERIGIVGRTGSGKTSLLNSIFRLMELIKGKITIDGFNIRQLPLRELREALCIIPQEPVLFKGTFRSNLDPFGDYTEEELWRALELSHMKEYVMTSHLKLDTEIVEGGQNISIGQKQLLCLTRVILKKNCKILILDEATSALDPYTDQLIQQVIRDVFKTQTILTIAHRLDTIKDYDKILVLHFGELVEFDTVENLLTNPNGYFRALYDSHSKSNNQ